MPKKIELEFRVKVVLTKGPGKADEDDSYLIEEVRQSIEDGDPGSVYNGEDTEYSVSEWDVTQVEAVREEG